MIALSLAEVARLCGGRLIVGDGGSADTDVSVVSTNTRSLAGGELFVALAGERFDGHDYLGVAVGSGAVALLVSREPESGYPNGVAVIEVEDTLIGLQNLAAGVRGKLDMKVCCLTGSSGKTSTKDMLAEVLAVRFSTSATIGNLNNHIGLPLTVLGASAEDEWGVWELGMNHPGEIAPLAEIARPDIAVITNVGVAHIEHMGSREVICQEKGEAIAALGADGIAVIPAEDDFADALAARCKGEVIRVGIGCGDVRAENLRPEGWGSRFDLHFPDGRQGEVVLGIPGQHMVTNSLLAAAVGWKAGLSPEEIAEGLGRVRLTGGRLEPKEVDGITFLDDSYNANPESLRAALETLAEFPSEGRRVAVLGRMAELGEVAEVEHRAAGAFAAGIGIDGVYTVGDEASWIWEGAEALAPGMSGGHFDDAESCAVALRAALSAGDLALLKGSREAAMEQVLQQFSSQ